MVTKTIILIVLYFGNYVYGQRYEGCFRSSVSDPDLPFQILNRASSPTECIKECGARYYMFAGLMNGQQCYCGSKFGRNGLSESCSTPCATDPTHYCGSQEAMSIYSTEQNGPSPPRSLQVTRNGSNILKVTWEPPDISNGDILYYTLRATAIETFASNTLPPVESQVQGRTSNMTILQGLQPGTKYNISIVAKNTKANSNPAYTVEWTSIGPPDKPPTPQIVNKMDTTITVLLAEGHSENGPITAYQVFVVQPGIIAPTGANISYTNYEVSRDQGLEYYITGEFAASEFHKYKRFVVGDGRKINGYYNAPLNNKVVPRIGLTAVSKFQREVQYAYSDITYSIKEYKLKKETSITEIILYIAIFFLGTLLLVSIFVYFTLRKRHEKIKMIKHPEQQELTLQGPVYEVDNIGYIPEDVPERVNHYQELKNKLWNIPRNILTIDDGVIRRGRFGTVHMGTVEKDNKLITVSVHTIADGLLRASEKKNMLRELDLCIKAASMKNLAGLIGTCETASTLYVVLEMPPQTLKNRLLAARSGDIFPINQMLPIGSAIASALQHLENYKIIHGHLCARSVGLCVDWTPKLMGHGIAKYALEDIKCARWTAVESFGNRKKQHSDDVWAFGVLLWEMFSMGGTPYSNLMLDSDVEEAVQRGVRLPQLQDIPDPLYEVMLSCWQIEIQERPIFAELMRLDTLSICPITAITEPYIPELELN